MRKMQTRFGIALGVFVAALGFSTNAFADFCVNADNGTSYRLQVGTGNPAAGTPIVITGTRTISTIVNAVHGTLFSTATATIIALTEVYPFGSGQFLHPSASMVMTFPKTPPINNRYDITFHGAGDPHNVMGGLAVINCPASDAAPAAGAAAGPDSNVK